MNMNYIVLQERQVKAYILKPALHFYSMSYLNQT